MKSLLTALLLLILFSFSAENPEENIKNVISKHEVQAHIEFLASDDMKGRDTGSPELEIAANYIASNFTRSGVMPVPGKRDFFQKVPVKKISPPSMAELKIGGESFALKQDLLVFSGGDTQVKGEMVFAGYGTPEDLDNRDIKGKIVVCLIGNPTDSTITRSFLSDAQKKNTLLRSRGALALIEVVSIPGVTMQGLANYFQKERIILQHESSSLPHLLIRNITQSPVMTTLKESGNTTGSLTVKGVVTEDLSAKNVIGMVEGKDPQLKNEFIVITAHYDHIGIGKKNVDGDSIFNGARDNAIGTTALLSATKYLAKNPPRRSVLFIAFTAEEKGLLGSKWYTENPLIPLQKAVFNLNADGGGYNDITITTINGMEYTNTEAEISKACTAFGLTASPDPVPQYNLYAGSDNYSFALKGIPAINVAPGIKAFDEEIMKYYHQLPDHASTLDFNYVTAYVRSFVYAGWLFSSQPKAPGWKADSPFRKNPTPEN